VFPYLEPPVFHVLGREIALFQILVCVAVIVGHEGVVRRAARRGYDRELASSLVAWTIFLGFVISHMVDVTLYTPERLRENPLELFKIWGSLSSFGGIIGGLLAGWAVTRWKGLSFAQQFEFLDVVVFVFPFAWIFGRLGCSLAHDHMGITTTHWLAVQAPGGARLDLGLLELLYTLLFLAPLFALLDRRPRPVGFYFALFFLLYCPIRFVLDTLRTGDPRYTALAWTPGQFACVAGTLFGAAILVWLLRNRVGAAVTEPAAAAQQPARRRAPRP
jgi:phosphatidylglycerol:prolipoprotein diacylglycerol transferase